jgi:uncharacterized protein with von Willebrand factor type A (vWA) domain
VRRRSRCAGPFDVKDLEVYKTENLITASTVIVLDMSMSMIARSLRRGEEGGAGAGRSCAHPRDYLELVVFSYFAELKAGRLRRGLVD